MNVASDLRSSIIIKIFCILPAGLGFNIRGGSDAPYLPNNPGIFVTSVRPGGVADRDRRLKRGDRILEVNYLQNHYEQNVMPFLQS